MKFEIAKTSVWDRETCPVPGATMYTEERTTVGGKNKGQKYTYIAWHIEVNSIEELVALSNRVEYALVISGRSVVENDIVGCIEIYDDYRE